MFALDTATAPGNGVCLNSTISRQVQKMVQFGCSSFSVQMISDHTVCGNLRCSRWKVSHNPYKEVCVHRDGGPGVAGIGLVTNTEERGKQLTPRSAE